MSLYNSLRKWPKRYNLPLRRNTWPLQTNCPTSKFYDRNQGIFAGDGSWSPPFSADPVVLDVNVRNTKPVGDYALKLGHIAAAGTYAVDTGPAPVIKTYKDVMEIAPLLRAAIQELTGKGNGGIQPVKYVSFQT